MSMSIQSILQEIGTKIRAAGVRLPCIAGTALTVVGLIGLGLLIHEKLHNRNRLAPEQIERTIESPSQWADEKVSHMAAVREAGRRMAEQLKSEQIPAEPNEHLTKAVLVEMVRARDKRIAELESRLKRQNETPVSFTQK